MKKRIAAFLLASTIIFAPISNINIPKSSLMACTGAMTWPIFLAMAIPDIIGCILPVGKAAAVVAELTTGEKLLEISGKLTIMGTEKLASMNPVNLIWTVIDVILLFTPAGAGMRTAKLFLLAPKLIAGL